MENNDRLCYMGGVKGNTSLLSWYRTYNYWYNSNTK
jgi:hypothetical protein